VGILAQEKDRETHSSREGIYGSHRRLLKEIWIAAIQQRQVSRNRG
jgi:hypothetical protein